MTKSRFSPVRWFSSGSVSRQLSAESLSRLHISVQERLLNFSLALNKAHTSLEHI